MKEQVYKSGFPKVSRLIAVISLIAVLAFMANFAQGYVSNEEEVIREQAYQETAEEIDNLFVMAVR